jgi:hypothetical protein
MLRRWLSGHTPWGSDVVLMVAMPKERKKVVARTFWGGVGGWIILGLTGAPAIAGLSLIIGIGAGGYLLYDRFQNR